MTRTPQSVSKLYYSQVHFCSLCYIEFVICVVKRGPDHYFKTHHEDANAKQIKEIFYQIASKTRTDIRTTSSEDDASNDAVNKDFEILVMLIRGIEATFSGPPSKTVCMKS